MTRINTHLVVALFCFFLFSLRALSQPTQMITDCNQLPDNVTQTSFYRSNHDTVLSTLRNHSSLGSYYSNATAGLSQNTIYGMFFCRGDINRTFCSDCVQTATLNIAKTCNSHKEAFIFYEECMVRFSNFSFFTLVEQAPTIARYDPSSSLDSPQFYNQTLPRKLDELIVRASSSSPVPYFVEGQEHVTQLEGSYNLEAMVQCSPDLDPRNCTVCLTFAVHDFLKSNARSAKIFFPKCLVRYNISALQPNGVTTGNEIFGRTFIAIMTAWVILLMSL